MEVHGCKTIVMFVLYLTFMITAVSSTCSSQNCSTYSSGCSSNRNCICFQMANGTGLCATNLISYTGFSSCTGNLSCLGNDSVCVNNSCFGQPLCYPLSNAGPSVCPPSNGSGSSNAPPTVIVTQVVTQTQIVTQPPPSRPVCFHGETVVLKKDGSACLMRNLAVGDQILVSKGYQLSLVWSIVLAIDVYQYYNEEKPIEYLEIYTIHSTSALHITPGHSLLLKKQNGTQPRYIFAYEARVGDLVYILNGATMVKEVIITDIRRKIFYDAYAPLTFEGNFVVNNMMVSAYGTFKHQLAHNIIKAPRRWLLRLGLAVFQKQTVEMIDMHLVDMMANMITSI